MPTEASLLLTMATIGTYLAVLWLPGGLAAAAAGVRGWALAASAPVFTYLIAGLAGPWLWKIGIPFNIWTFLLQHGAGGRRLRRRALVRGAQARPDRARALAVDAG
ncbi:hypothetical protein FXN61_19240, partial [Lentzea sp. PSKA42]